MPAPLSGGPATDCEAAGFSHAVCDVDGLWCEERCDAALANVGTSPARPVDREVPQMSAGSLLGVGTDNQLYFMPGLGSNWAQVPNSGAVVDVTQLKDGTIVGVGTDTYLWTRAGVNTGWVQVPNSSGVKG